MHSIFFENERLSSADLHCNITDTVDTSVFGCLKRAGLELIDEAKKYPERWNALVSDQKYQLINDRLLEGLKRVLRVLLEIAKTTAQLNSYDIKNLKCKIFGGVSAYLKVVDYVECDEECRELVGKIQSTILNNIDKLTKLEGGCDAIKPVFTLEHKEELFAQSIHMTDTALVFNRDGKVVFHGHGVDFYINGQKFESINAKDVLCVGYNRQPQVNSISEWYASAYVFFKIDEEHYTAIWIQRYFNGMFLEDKNSPEYQMAENWAAVIGVKFETSLNPFTYWEHPRPYEGYQHVDYSKYKRIPGKSKIKWCYVATCVYGSYDCPEVWVLRRFRDYKLDKTWYGKAFIKVYYAISPIFVKLFGKTKWFKTMWKGVLDKMVEKYKAQGFEDTPYNDLY